MVVDYRRPDWPARVYAVDVVFDGVEHVRMWNALWGRTDPLRPYDLSFLAHAKIGCASGPVG